MNEHDYTAQMLLACGVKAYIVTVVLVGLAWLIWTMWKGD